MDMARYLRFVTGQRIQSARRNMNATTSVADWHLNAIAQRDTDDDLPACSNRRSDDRREPGPRTVNKFE
jgi:hypothetical protein